MNLKLILKNEFISGRTTFDWFWLFIGCSIQFLACIYGYITNSLNSDIISIVCAFSGIFGMVFVAQGKISTYIFFNIQTITYMIIVYKNKLWGEFFENIFYFFTQFPGIYIWYKNYKQRKETKSIEISAKKLNKMGWIITSFYLIIGTFILTIILNKTNDSLPFIDAVSTTPAFSAQMLLIFGYKEQWIHWLIINFTSAIMFLILKNWMMFAMFVFWTLNCIYGWFKWSNSVNYKKWEEIK